MKKALQGIVLLIFLGLAAFAFQQWRGRVDRVEFLPDAPPQPGSRVATAPPAPLPHPTPAPNVAPEFPQFLSEEAASLNETHVDAKAAEARLREQVARMREPEFLYARDLVLSETAPANEQIVAAYLIAQGGPKARKAQEDLVLREFPPAAADTAEEQKNMAAKAHALQTIEQVAQEARTSREARDHLEDWARREKDATLLKHLKDAIRGLPPL